MVPDVRQQPTGRWLKGPSKKFFLSRTLKWNMTSPVPHAHYVVRKKALWPFWGQAAIWVIIMEKRSFETVPGLVMFWVTKEAVLILEKKCSSTISIKHSTHLFITSSIKN